jgi:predicted TIM-barrel fold metal-dependent hydrolase
LRTLSQHGIMPQTRGAKMTATRRSVIGGMAALAAAPALAQGTAKLAFTLPDGACDCHHHIYDRRWAYLPDAINKPPFATIADYRRQVLKRLGFTRHVVVQPSTYGLDNGCLVDALKQQGDHARGVAVVGASVSDGELNRLHAAGVRGVRIQYGLGDPVKLPEIEPLGRRIGRLGWHIQFNMTPAMYLEQEALIARLPVPVMLDHMARVADTASANFRSLRRLLDRGNTWVKISGAYLYGKAPAPDYADSSAVARALVAAHPERCVWGTDWPHPDASSGRVKMPDDVNLVNLFGRWVQDAALRQRILVENPERFYGFDPKKRPKAGSVG